MSKRSHIKPGIKASHADLSPGRQKQELCVLLEAELGYKVGCELRKRIKILKSKNHVP